MSQPFGDIPLFRELQRILASGEGPINLEVARQIAGTVATQTPDPSPTAEASRALADATRKAEVLLVGYTRLQVDEPLRSKTMGRATWVLTALEGWKWLLEGLAARFTQELSKLGPEEGEAANPMGQVMGQIAPLLLGIQTGTVIGHLANDALARHDPPIPFEDDGALFFVTSNMERVADEYDFDLDTFRGWLALHEAARQVVLSSIPWVGRYLRGLLTGLVDAIEIDAGDMERRLIDLQEGGAEALQSGAALEQVIPVAETERYRHALKALRSFLAVFEGYSEHAADAVTSSLLGDATRIDEGMARIRSSPSDGKALLANVLGIERDRALETAGQTFCAAVVQMKGIAALNRVWEAPDNLPSLDEIKDPFAWMERVLADDAADPTLGDGSTAR
ncbi:MAG TPA: zinc-dependent metalloprotease [Actinomycetota bacterium]|nr:zinc-dependent metalloprotease [Actinomycetota bacterium]